MVEYVNYKGEQLPVRISYSVLKGLKKKGIDISDIDKDISTLSEIFWLAYLLGCKTDGIVAKYKYEDVEDILDESYLSFLSLIPIFFSSEGGEVDVKKK